VLKNICCHQHQQQAPVLSEYGSPITSQGEGKHRIHQKVKIPFKISVKSLLVTQSKKQTGPQQWIDCFKLDIFWISMSEKLKIH